MGHTGEPRVPEFVRRLAKLGPAEEKHVVCRRLAMRCVASFDRAARQADRKEKVNADLKMLICQSAMLV